MTRDSSRSELEVLGNLGRKIGIADLSMEDFDLVFASAHGVEKYCDQFETIDLTTPERFHFMQLIVASLNLALKQLGPGAKGSERRVEILLRSDLAEYKYIIDYWGRDDAPWAATPMMRRLKNDAQLNR